MKPQAFELHQESSLDSACDMLADGRTRPIGGGQSLGPMLNLRLARPEALLDLSTLSELHGSRRVPGGLMIGATVTHAEIEDGLIPDNTGGILPRVANGIAYRAVRSRGTLGGSIAHADPSADWITTLCALDAQVILQARRKGKDAHRRLMLSDFVTGALQTAIATDELLVAVFVPDLPASARFGYFKLCRKTGELAHAMGAVLQAENPDQQRAVFGALPGAPLILKGATALEKSTWQQALKQRYADMDHADLTLRLRVMERALQRSNDDGR